MACPEQLLQGHIASRNAHTAQVQVQNARLQITGSYIRQGTDQIFQLLVLHFAQMLEPHTWVLDYDFIYFFHRAACGNNIGVVQSTNALQSYFMGIIIIVSEKKTAKQAPSSGQ